MGTEREEPSKLAFDRYLREVCKVASLEWEPGPGRYLRPDRYLAVAGVRYAVEMTSTHTTSESTSGEPIPLETHRATLMRFAEDAERSARGRGVLRGYYLIHSYRPIADFTRKRESLLALVANYIEQTKEPDSAPAGVFDPRSRLSGFIWKLKVAPDRVEYSGGSCGAFEGEASENTTHFVRAALCKKVEKYRGDNHTDPRILLIWNTYPLAERASFEPAKALPELAAFHSVFIILNSGTVFVLSTKNPDWEPTTEQGSIRQ